eukprot:124385_1
MALRRIQKELKDIHSLKEECDFQIKYTWKSIQETIIDSCKQISVPSSIAQMIISMLKQEIDPNIHKWSRSNGFNPHPMMKYKWNIDHWSVVPLHGDIIKFYPAKWKIAISGPADTPYFNGIFFVQMMFPQEYPFKPPKWKMLTKIYHCNINEKGGICLPVWDDYLKCHWSPSLTASKLISLLIGALVEPNPDNPLVPNIAKLYRTNRTLHDEKAREWTKNMLQCEVLKILR